MLIHAGPAGGDHLLNLTKSILSSLLTELNQQIYIYHYLRYVFWETATFNQ